MHAVRDQVCLFDLAKTMHAGIEGSQPVPFDNGGHGFLYEEHDQVNSELFRFFIATTTQYRGMAADS